MPEPVDDFSLQCMVGFALTKARLPGRKLTDEERTALAKAVVDHFKLCRWQAMANPAPMPRSPDYEVPG